MSKILSCERCTESFERAGPSQKYCKTCSPIVKREKDAQYRSANREALAAKSRAWRQENLDRDKERRAKLKAERPEILAGYERTKYERHGEKIRERARKHYWDNRGKVLERMSSPDGRAYSRETMRRKMEDPGFRLHSNVSKLIRSSLKDKGGRSWEGLVGYTTEELKGHLERQFAPGMSWENYGKWHVDHIIPRASFNFEAANDNDPDFKACWALTNLRPLWASENISKGAKRTHLI